MGNKNIALGGENKRGRNLDVLGSSKLHSIFQSPLPAIENNTYKFVEIIPII